MSFVGKVLVVLQLTLSLLFMCFAAAVNQSHVNWKKKADEFQKQLTETNKRLSDEQQARESDKTQHATELAKAEQRAGKAEAENVGLNSQVAKLEQEKKDLTLAAAQANEQSQIAREEARDRREAYVQLSEINTKLLASRNEEAELRRSLQKDVQKLTQDLDTAVGRNKDLLTKLSIRDRKLSELGISGDDPSLTANVSVPPTVEGKITNTMAVKSSGGSELVQISLGSDAGLIKGHKLYVWRSGLKEGGKLKLVGRIQIVSTTPDGAVAVVMDKDRGGEILKGDNVSTRLN